MYLTETMSVETNAMYAFCGPETSSLSAVCGYTIMLTCPCNFHPLTPHFYIVKLGFTGVYIFFLIFALKHSPLVTCTQDLCFEQK